jgi:hypothetical protein
MERKYQGKTEFMESTGGKELGIRNRRIRK